MHAGVVAPRRAHRQRILTDRDRDAEGGAEFHRHRLDRVEQVRVLSGLPAGGHPVRREHHALDARDVRGHDVGERLRHCHPARRPRIEQREGRALSHRHRFPGVSAEAAQGHRAVGHRHLPRTHHRVAGDKPADGAVGDGHQERLVGHRRHAQHPFQGGTDFDPPDLDPTGVEWTRRRWQPNHVAVQAGKIAEQGSHRHGDRRGIEPGVAHLQPSASGRLPDRCPRTALALAQRGEIVDATGIDGEDVSFLGFVAPDFER